MRFLLILLVLAGCGATPEQALTGVAAVGVGSIVVIGRSPFDALYSMLAGKDCVVWLSPDFVAGKPPLAALTAADLETDLKAILPKDKK